MPHNHGTSGVSMHPMHRGKAVTAPARMHSIPPGKVARASERSCAARGRMWYPHACLQHNPKVADSG
ncbi:MAG: hypothetical protein FE78DRAFT_102745 [Acidomyces sp. 'richmondensis']|nr:MAG: hypothetical protein FE78DRAFT_102745 [Acidomyces sp. 'richmondensis']